MSTQYFDDDGQEYGFDTHGMRMFTDRTFTCELPMTSVNKKALAKILGGEPIIRCKDCNKDGTSKCAMAYWDMETGEITAWNRPNEYCSRGERK